MRPRLPDLVFGETSINWAPNREFAQRFNASSIAATHVEPFINRVMLLCKGKLGPENQRLRDDVDTFVRQESNHYRMHDRFNEKFRAEGGAAMASLETRLKADYRHMLAHRSLRFNAAYAAGFESAALFLAEFFFTQIDDLLEHADRNAVALFKWHLAEEYEHRSVCFDVYQKVFGSYFVRIYATWFAFQHLGAFGQDMTRLLLEGYRAGVSEQDRAASIRREQDYRRRFLRFVGPRLLHLLSPFYDPASAPPPKGVEEWLDMPSR